MWTRSPSTKGTENAGKFTAFGMMTKTEINGLNDRAVTWAEKMNWNVETTNERYKDSDENIRYNTYISVTSKEV